MKITSIYSIFVKKSHDKKLLIPVFTLFVLQSCTVVRPGEGVKQRMGKLSNEITTQGPALFNSLLVKLLRLLFKQMI
jgi:hypothetical protein